MIPLLFYVGSLSNQRASNVNVSSLFPESQRRRRSHAPMKGRRPNDTIDLEHLLPLFQEPLTLLTVLTHLKKQLLQQPLLNTWDLFVQWRTGDSMERGRWYPLLSDVPEYLYLSRAIT